MVHGLARRGSPFSDGYDARTFNRLKLGNF